MKPGRFVIVRDENIMGEVMSQQLHGAFVKFYKGGFECIEYLTDEDYEEMDDFEEDSD